MNITDNLSWSKHIDAIAKKAHQHIYIIGKLRIFHMSPITLSNFCRCTIASILLECITAWYDNRSAQDRKILQSCEQHLTKTNSSPTSTPPALHATSGKQPLKDYSYLIILPPPQPFYRRYRGLKLCTNIFKNIFPTVTTLE